MPAFDTTPIYNLKAVVQETGLKPDTLRAWERRYGLPEPDRTSGGHRLYSQHDIEVLKWLIARQDEGMSISRAVDLWHTLGHEGRDPLSMMEYAAVGNLTFRPHTVTNGGSLIDLREGWLDACLMFDGQRAEALLAQAFAAHPPEIVCFEVLMKGLSEVGSGWYQGEFTVQQEHFASALAMRRLEALVAAAPPPTRPGRILIGCALGDDHTFGAQLLTLLLRRQGYDIVYLGANVPVEHLEHTLATARPDLVVMSAQQLYTAANLLDVSDLLGRLRTPLAFGGRAFIEIPGLVERIPGSYLGNHLPDAPQVIERMLGLRHTLPRIEPVPREYQRTLMSFRKHKLEIETHIWHAIEQYGIGSIPINIANLNLGRNIEAALKLGDMDTLRPDLAWINGLLLNLRMDNTLLRHYVSAYQQSVERVIGQEGRLITEWLREIETSKQLG